MQVVTVTRELDLTEMAERGREITNPIPASWEVARGRLMSEERLLVLVQYDTKTAGKIVDSADEFDAMLAMGTRLFGALLGEVLSLYAIPAKPN